MEKVERKGKQKIWNFEIECTFFLDLKFFFILEWFMHLSKYLSEIIDLPRKQTRQEIFSTPSSDPTLKQHRKRLKCFCLANETIQSFPRRRSRKMSFGNVGKHDKNRIIKTSPKHETCWSHSKTFSVWMEDNFLGWNSLFSPSVVSDEAFNNSST